MAAIPDPPREEDYIRADTMTEREKALRDMFVAEYLIDYNQVNAAMRCGFPREFAVRYASQFMDEAYVQRKIKSVEYTGNDEVAEAEYNRKRIKNQLMREAHYRGPGSSHAARVSALAALAKLENMEPASQHKHDVNMQGGVMRIPAPPNSTEAWEATAVQSQADLANGKIS
jgi:hypothetical protein